MNDPPDTRLDSWKEIAAHLKRDVSTVQRWEKREGMPVYRHLHNRLGSVYAFPAELDAWLQSRNVQEDEDAPPVDRPVASNPDGRTRSQARRWFAWALVAVVLLAFGGALRLVRATTGVWRNPLQDAQFRPLTDFDGNESAAAVSRDGRFVAFLSDEDGRVDVWVTRVGSNQFHNLTGGRLQELVNPSVRTLEFTPDGASVTFWVRRIGATKPDDISIWAVPTLGGEPRPLLADTAELDWSNHGARLAYHTPGPGDPTFVGRGTPGADRQLFVAASGLHAHFPVWSPDDRFIYFVQGTVPDQMDIWRIGATGGPSERLTFHNSRVSYPAFLNPQTLLYLATARDGSGPWLFAFDVEQRVTHRLSVGAEPFTSLSASADGRTLAVTVAKPRSTLWRVAITSEVLGFDKARPIAVPTVHAGAPRLGPGYLLYVSSRAGSDDIWKLAEGTGQVTQLWSAPGARIVGPPAIAPDGGRIAFAAEQQERSRLFVMNADGSNVHTVSAISQPHGEPAWSPDGRSIAIADARGGMARLVRVRLDDGSVVPLASEYSTDPAWSPDGRRLVYSGADVGTTFPVKSVSADGKPMVRSPLMLSRGGRRLRFLAGGRLLVMLRGDLAHKDFWLRDVETGVERRLTDFGGRVSIRDFDVSADGRQIVFDQVWENSDLALINVPGTSTTSGTNATIRTLAGLLFHR
jgi:Tol biopolymer transport system component